MFNEMFKNMRGKLCLWFLQVK